jgi:hypothetical protein
VQSLFQLSSFTINDTGKSHEYVLLHASWRHRAIRTWRCGGLKAEKHGDDFEVFECRKDLVSDDECVG